VPVDAAHMAVVNHALAHLLPAVFAPSDVDPLSFPTRRSSDLPPEWPIFTAPRLTLSTIHKGEDDYRVVLTFRCFFRCRRRSDSPDRKSTRLNSSHVSSSYAVFCFTKNTTSTTSWTATLTRTHT